MTTKQIKRMLKAEGIGYAVISIPISSAVGLPVSFVVFNGMNLYRISFSVPWISNFFLFGIIVVVCMTAPVIIYRKTQNQSIIDRMRNRED